MISIVALVVAVIALILLVSDGVDEDANLPMGRDAITVDMISRALERYDEQGRESTIQYYNSQESVEGEWYIFIFDESGRNIAHANPDLIGEDLNGDVGVDSTGYRFGDSILDATENGHWVDYLFDNLATGNQEYKHSWVVKHDGLIFGSGWYQVLPKFQ